MPNPNLSLQNRQRKLRLRLDSLRPAFEAVIAAAGVDDREVGVQFVSEVAIHRANRDWRGVDRPTDCLSFPAGEGEGGEFAGSVLGDILISPQTAQRQAVDAPHTPGAATDPDTALDQELVFLFVHSLLHLMGFDHGTAAGARAMKARERAILAAIAGETL